MTVSAVRALMLAGSMLALAACATPPEPSPVPPPPARESTPFTLATDQPRPTEQVAMQFDKADLAIRVIPQDQAIDAVAVLDFTATAPLERLIVELDTLLTISSVQVDGQDIPTGRWSNPEGRLTVELPQTLPAGRSTSLRIAYAGKPRGLTNPYIFWRIRMASCKQGILAGTVLAIARSLGEYGATSMVSEPMKASRPISVRCFITPS